MGKLWDVDKGIRVMLHAYDCLYTCNIARTRLFVHVYDRLYVCTITRLRSFAYTYYCASTIVCIRAILHVHKRAHYRMRAIVHAYKLKMTFRQIMYV